MQLGICLVCWGRTFWTQVRAFGSRCLELLLPHGHAFVPKVTCASSDAKGTQEHDESLKDKNR